MGHVQKKVMENMQNPPTTHTVPVHFVYRVNQISDLERVKTCA